MYQSSDHFEFAQKFTGVLPTEKLKTSHWTLFVNFALDDSMKQHTHKNGMT